MELQDCDEGARGGGADDAGEEEEVKELVDGDVES